MTVSDLSPSGLRAIKMTGRAARESYPHGEADLLRTKMSCPTTEEELKKLKKSSAETWGQVKLLLAKDTPKAVGKAVGDVLICLLVPAVSKVRQAADRTQQAAALAPGRGAPRAHRSWRQPAGARQPLGRAVVAHAGALRIRALSAATGGAGGADAGEHRAHLPGGAARA